MQNYYKSVDECLNAKKERKNTNPKYKYFKQVHFTAGDEDQFITTLRDQKIEENALSERKLDHSNIFQPYSFDFYSKFSNFNSCINTFSYMFYKFKKGIYIEIKDNKIDKFIPFSNVDYKNEWYYRLKTKNLVKAVQKYDTINTNVNKNVKRWHANNSFFRYEFPTKEEDTNVSNMYDMFFCLCENRKLPNISFFINRRDFPILRRDETESYTSIFGNSCPMISHKYSSYTPILSMVTTNEQADIVIPTGEDWARISWKYGKFFHKYCDRVFDDKDFCKEWNKKKNIAIFRGASTGEGITSKTNPRLKLIEISECNPEILDAGFTKFCNRPRIINSEITNMDITKLKIVPSLSPVEQSFYKYIINVDGHVSAFRLSLELGMNSCILLVNSKYKLWFRDFLIPYVHFVPIKENLSNIVEMIHWCIENDEKCEKIAKNARAFYDKYLQDDGIYDYLQNLLKKLTELK